MLRTFSRRTSWYSLVNSRAVEFLFPRYIKRSASHYTVRASLLSLRVIGLSTQQIPLCHWQFEMNDHVYLSISKRLLYNRTSDLFNELSFKLITTGTAAIHSESSHVATGATTWKRLIIFCFVEAQLQTTVVLSSLRDRSLVISLCMVLMDVVCRWKWPVPDKYSVPGGSLGAILAYGGSV